MIEERPQPSTYDALAKALEGVGLLGQRQNRDQLVVSSQEGPVWPNRGNSFWVSLKEKSWHLSTWSPRGYRVPADQDLVALCLACMSAGGTAMYRVPPEIVAKFGMQELDDNEYERLFLTGGAGG